MCLYAPIEQLFNKNSKQLVLRINIETIDFYVYFYIYKKYTHIGQLHVYHIYDLTLRYLFTIHYSKNTPKMITRMALPYGHHQQGRTLAWGSYEL